MFDRRRESRDRRAAAMVARWPRVTVAVTLPKHSSDRLVAIRLSVAACLKAELAVHGDVVHRDGLEAFRWVLQCGDRIPIDLREAVVGIGALEFRHQWSELVKAVDRLGVPLMRSCLEGVLRKVGNKWLISK